MKTLPRVIEILKPGPCGRIDGAVFCNGMVFVDRPTPREAVVNLELLLESAQWPPEMEKEGAREMAAIVLAVLKEGVK